MAREVGDIPGYAMLGDRTGPLAWSLMQRIC